MEIHNDYCSRCGGEAHVNFSTNKLANGDIKHYYHCRDCNRKRYQKYYHANKEKCREIIYRSIKKHKEKQSARQKLNHAIKVGKIHKPDTCESCNQKQPRIEGAHTDYTKPLEVTWLCPACHRSYDRQQKQNVG